MGENRREDKASESKRVHTDMLFSSESATVQSFYPCGWTCAYVHHPRYWVCEGKYPPILWI